MSTNQACQFLIYIATGILICIFFDIFRALRKTIKTSNKLTYIEDVVFWIVVGAILIFEIFKLNYGELRLYIFLGLILGSSIYLLTISKYFIKVNVAILTFFKKLVINVISPIFKITKFIIAKIKIFINKLNNKKTKLKGLYKLKKDKIKK